MCIVSAHMDLLIFAVDYRETEDHDRERPELQIKEHSYIGMS